MNTQLPLIPYLRKSSGEDEALSFDRQLKACQAWAAVHDVPLAEPVREPHVSGSKDWRARALGDAVSAIEAGQAQGLIVEEQNRLSRGTLLQQAEIWSALERADARLVVVASGLDTASQSADDEFNYGLQALIARKQWREFKRRSDAVKADRIEAGIFIGPAPTGYKKGPTRGLTPDPDMAPVVRELFELRAGGSTWGALLKHIDARTGRKWTQPGVAGIIRNRAYLGDLVYGEFVKEKAHEALVDAPLWHAAQRKGKAPARSGRKTDKWLLSGLLACGSCEHSLIVWRGATTRNGRPQAVSRRYRCTHRACPARQSVNAPDIEAWTVSTLWMLLGSRVVEPHETIDLAPLVEAVSTAQRRLDQVMAPEARDDLGPLWSADVRARRTELEEAETALGAARASAGDDVEAAIIDLRERWDELGTTERRERLGKYAIERVVVNGPKPADWVLMLP